MKSLPKKTWDQLIKNGRASHRYLLEKVFSLFCALGCLFQLYHITTIYLRFEVITDISIEIPRSLILPDITVCVEVAQFINLTKLDEKYPSLVEDMIAYDRVSNQANTTSVHQLNESVITYFVLRRLRINDTYDLMYPEEHLIKSWETGMPKKANSTLKEQGCRMRSRFKDFGFCVTLGCSMHEPQVFTELEHLRTGVARPLFAVVLNAEGFTRINNFYVALLQHNALPRGSKIKFITLNKKSEPHEYPIEYHMFTTSLLPLPYTTGCVDYKSLKYDTMEHARELCLTNISLARFGVPFQKVLADPEWTNYFGINLSVDARQNETLQRELDKMFLECLELTRRPHCHDTFYLTSQNNEEAVSGRDSFLDLRMPVEPYITTSCNPKQSLLEYLIYVGSIMGTWFGFNFAFSVPEILEYIYSLLRSLFCKKLSRSKLKSANKVTRCDPVVRLKGKKFNPSVDRTEQAWSMYYMYDGYLPKPRLLHHPAVPYYLKNRY